MDTISSSIKSFSQTTFYHHHEMSQNLLRNQILDENNLRWIFHADNHFFCQTLLLLYYFALFQICRGGSSFILL